MFAYAWLTASPPLLILYLLMIPLMWRWSNNIMNSVMMGLVTIRKKTSNRKD